MVCSLLLKLNIDKVVGLNEVSAEILSDCVLGIYIELRRSGQK